jgi:hypothetical protein
LIFPLFCMILLWLTYFVRKLLQYCCGQPDSVAVAAPVSDQPSSDTSKPAENAKNDQNASSPTVPDPTLPPNKCAWIYRAIYEPNLRFRHIRATFSLFIFSCKSD